MLTNNGKAICFVSHYIPNSHNPRYILCNTTGTIATFERHTENQPKERNYSYLCNNMEIVVGSGITAANVHDIKLENEITASNLKCLYKRSQNAISDCVNWRSPLIMHATKTYYNSSSTENIVINEIGLITKDGYGFDYLLVREVLEDSLIIEPDEIVTLTITID